MVQCMNVGATPKSRPVDLTRFERRDAMDWTTIITSVFAGELAGPLTVAWINRLKDMKLAKIKAEFDRKKEFDSWLRQERYRASINLIDLIASHYSRTDFDNWPDEIRAVSVRIHLLYKTGTAPETLANAIQNVFQLALNRKLGRVKNDEVQ